MSIDRQRVRQYLKTFDFDGLFREELGWDNTPSIELKISTNNRNFRITAIAEKRKFLVYVCQPEDDEGIPDRATCNKIDRLVTDYTREQFIIYTDEARQEQYWQWVRREKGKPTALRGERFHASQSGERLLQKLESLYISWEEEDELALSDVKKKTKRAFDVEKVTKKFYAEFKSQHGKFLDFIKGIQDQFDKEWYASLMLNRLMFIYFIQQKGFLDGNQNYLQDRLQWCKANRGEDEFQSFYRFFLLKLFHDGLGSPQRDNTELNALLGKVPYLNGGLFEVHQLEDTYSDIQIPDSAFERIFAFFDQWDWHLDDRPNKSECEINPDVLGYIFEKYINQKQMGAYYTKEDITEYISKNTIIPYLFNAAEKGCKIPFEPGGSVWRLLQENPDHYLYDAVKKGVIDDNNVIPLPDDIAAGINDVSQRGGWNRLAPEEYGLPTEIWREHVARRQRCLEVREKLLQGEIHSINDLITYNLDIRQFAQDVIDTCEGPELLKAFYKAITAVSVLDPTCGSGAFLFAALNILQPLYEACLERMQGFVDDLDCEPHPEKFKPFRTTLEQVAKHTNRNYFIFKSIILNNLYGVDIMVEATEICKLRLFLKLVSQVEVDPSKENLGLEPLPDIDFNVRAGNTLVGFATLEEVRRAITQDQVKSKRSAVVSEEASQFKLEFGDDLSRINEAAESADRAYQMFRQMQTQQGMSGRDFAEKKQEVRQRLKTLNDELNTYLAKECSVDSGNFAKYQHFLKTHQPFHWLAEFYGVLAQGGFSIAIGNPPYIESKNVKDYTVKSFLSDSCKDLYAYTLERAVNVSDRNGRIGFIVPMSCFSVERFRPIQNYLTSKTSSLMISHWSGDAHPSKLFEGVDKRLEIILGTIQKTRNFKPQIFTTKYIKWYSEERAVLFKVHPVYQEQNFEDSFFSSSLPKISSSLESSILKKLKTTDQAIKAIQSSGGKSKVYYTRKVSFFLQFLDFIPKVFDKNGRQRDPSELKSVEFKSEEIRDVCLSCLTSSLFYWFNIVSSDCRNLNKREIVSFPVPTNKLLIKHDLIADFLEKIMASYEQNSSLRTVFYQGKGDITVQYFNFRPSKPLIDKLDKIIHEAYGLTKEESDFLVSFDVKYRLGKDQME